MGGDVLKGERIGVAHFRIVSKAGEALAVAFRLQEEDHRVDAFIADPLYQHDLDGMVDKVPALLEGSSKDTVFIFDSSGLGREARLLHRHGYRVFGASPAADRMELSRDRGLLLAKRLGLHIPKFALFEGRRGLGRAQRFVERRGGGWVLKFFNNVAYSLVPESPHHLIEHLSYLQSAGIVGDRDRFILQEFVEGVELSCEIWVARGRPLIAPNTTVEQKYLGDHMGGQTGGETALVWFHHRPNPLSRLCGLLIQQPELRGYVGPWDVNVIVDDQGDIWFLEHTPRLGIPAIYALMEMVDDFGGLIMEGFKERREMKPRQGDSGYGYALNVSVAPYPLSQRTADKKEGEAVERVYSKLRSLPVLFDDHQEKSIWWQNAFYDEEDDKIKLTGSGGVVAVCSGQGELPGVAMQRATAVAEKVVVSDRQFCNEGLGRFEAQRQRIEEILGGLP